MTKVDQFESMFRSASREVYRYDPIHIESVLVVTDRDATQAKLFGDRIRPLLNTVSSGKTMRRRDVNGSEFKTAGELLDLVEGESPDLICTYRNLHSGAWRWPYSLGAHIDLLTQHTHVPVMLLPHPLIESAENRAFKDIDSVMAIADHLTGDHRLVNYAQHFAAKGTLWLTHIEDEATFERYMSVISKISSIDTDEARKAVRDQLLKEPLDYIRSCSEILQQERRSVKVEHLVAFGHHLSEYKRLIAAHNVDLLVLNTKDEDQLAMHGMAYALAVELRQTPLLML